MGGRWPRAVGVLVDEVTHGAQVRGVFGKGGGDRRLQRSRAVGVEQLQEPPGEHAQVCAALGGAQEQRLRTRCGVMQAVLRTVRTGGALVGDEGLDMGLDFDLRIAVETARMRGEHVTAVEDAHGVERSEHGERAAHVRVGYRVVVQIEARVRGLAHAHLDALLGRERVLGQSKQTRLLLGEDRAHSAGAVLRAQPVGSGALTPGVCLRIEIVEVAEGARGEEGVTYEADRALDPSFFISPGHRHRAWLEAVVTSELQQGGMEADGVALPGLPRKESLT